MLKNRGCFTQLFLALIVGGGLTYGVVVLLNPWALHIGGRSTPFLIWNGGGTIHTKDGHNYLLWITFYPSSHLSRLRLDGVRPTGGVTGTGWLCTSPGALQQLNVSGTIYGGWRSTDDSLMTIRATQKIIFNTGQSQGYFDLTGKWHGQQWVLDGRSDGWGKFPSGALIDHAFGTLEWTSQSDFKTLCASQAKGR